MKDSKGEITKWNFRLDKEIRVYDLLNELGVNYEHRGK